MFKLYFKGLGILVLVILGLWGVGIVTGVLGTAGNILSTPQRVLNKTLDTENVIHNYEWFHDVYQSQNARVNQIVQFKDFLSEETDSSESRKLRMELAAQQMTCRNLVAKYNANSEKMNVGIFRGWSLPESLNINTCE